LGSNRIRIESNLQGEYLIRA